MSEKTNIDKVEQKLPMGRNIIYALQHVFVMVAGAVAVPLMVGGAAGQDTTFLISCALFAAGIATILQTLGATKFIGAKIPIVEGTSFASVTAMTGIAATALNSGDGTLGLREISGAVLIAGLFCFIFSGIWGKMLKFFPPVVTGTVVTTIGLSLFPVGIKWISGPTYAPAKTPNLILALLTLMLVLLFTKFFKGVLGNLSVLLGIVAGTVMAIAHDLIRADAISGGTAMALINFESVKKAVPFAFPKPYAFGAPIFKMSSVFSLLLIMLVIMTEATGNIIAVHNMSGKELDEKNLSRGLRSSGLATMISSVFNSYPVTAFAQNVGMLSLTGVYSRFMAATAGIFLTLLAFFPKFAAAFAAIPQPVLGGAGFAMFGMVAVGGIRTLGSKVKYDGTKNAMIVAVSIGLSLIPTAVPEFFSNLPPALSGILHSGITLGSISAILLNLFFNVLGAPKTKETKEENKTSK